MVKQIKKIILTFIAIITTISNLNILAFAEDMVSSENTDEAVQNVEKDKWSYEDDEITVTVNVNEDALPEDAELFVTKLDDEVVEQYADEETNTSVGYDIGFTSDGEEVEPTTSASVSISLKKESLGTDVDTNSLKVEHIKDDETSDIVADAFEEDAVTETDETVDTTFTTDSFSYFVIHYNNNYKIYAHLIDLDGSEFPASESDQLTITASYDQANFYAWNRKQNIWVELKTLVATYGEFTNGYTYQGTHLTSIDGTEIKWIYYKTSSNTWYYSTSDDRPTSAPSSSTPTISANSSVYCVYRKDYESNSEIQDLYTTTGTLYLAKPAGISDTAEVTYKWYRCSTKYGDYEYAKRQKVTGGSYTVVSDENGTSMYPALDVTITDEYLIDQTVRFWYKVEVYVNGTLYETTEPVQNQYYASLQNGSFEDVSTQAINYGQHGSFLPEGTTGLSWKTTGDDHQLEVVYAPNAKSAYGLNVAADGNQFAELNAEAAGALYQDVMSTPDTTLYWKLYHRARQGTDTMYLVIAPTNEVSEITTQSQLTALISKIQADEDGYAEKGYYLKTISDSTSAWGKYTGDYSVPDGCYLTRMFFVAGSTGSGSTKVGNFIDAVAFTPLMPDPDAGYGNITVNKTVDGITAEDIKNYKVQITVTNTTTNTVVENKIFDCSTAKKNDDGSYDLSFSLYQIQADNNYKVEETVLTDLSTLEASYEELGITYALDGGTAQTYPSSGVTFTLSEGTTKTVDLVNRYKPSAVKLDITNTVSGNLGSKDKAFSYVVDITNTDGTTTQETFTLVHGESKSLEIPYASSVTVTQTDYSSDGYSTYYTLDDDDTRQSKYTYTIDTMKNDAEIHFVNSSRSAVPTGSHNTNGTLAIFGIVMIGILSVIGRRILEKR